MKSKSNTHTHTHSGLYFRLLLCNKQRYACGPPWPVCPCVSFFLKFSSSLKNKETYARLGHILCVTSTMRKWVLIRVWNVWVGILTERERDLNSRRTACCFTTMVICLIRFVFVLWKYLLKYRYSWNFYVSNKKIK